jgi:competence protein ComEC
MKPLYKQIYFTNKLLNMVWQLNAVTLSAQILTIPIILFYFHQFPTLFLFTNFIAVPLSSLILYTELILILVSPFQTLCKITGQLISWLIFQMNGLIERTDSIPFSVIENIPFALIQTLLLYLAIGSAAWWLMQQKMKGLKLSIFLLTVCCLLSFTKKWDQNKQSKLVVYEVPKFTAIDIIHQDHYKLFCDSIISVDKNLEKMHLQAPRLNFGATKKETEQLLDQGIQQLPVEKLSVLLINRPFHLPVIQHKIHVDLIILSHATRVNLKQLAEIFDCQQYVFDGSNPLWKIQEWKKDADNLHLRHHSTAEQGALVVDL